MPIQVTDFFYNADPARLRAQASLGELEARGIRIKQDPWRLIYWISTRDKWGDWEERYAITHEELIRRRVSLMERIQELWDSGMLSDTQPCASEAARLMEHHARQRGFKNLDELNDVLEWALASKPASLSGTPMAKAQDMLAGWEYTAVGDLAPSDKPVRTLDPAGKIVRRGVEERPWREFRAEESERVSWWRRLWRRIWRG